MSKTFITLVEMQNYIESACEKAVSNACDILLGKLQELIMSEYYDVFDPVKYSRSEQFYRSAMTEKLSKTVGMIFMNPGAMNYPFNGFGWEWTGEQQIELGNQGIHGGWSTEESLQHHYWDSFEEWCNKNAIKILKEQLILQGIKLSK